MRCFLLFSVAPSMCLLILQTCTSHPPFKLLTSSPSNTYRVEIVENSSREYGAIAHWNAFKGDKKIVDQSTIYNAAPPPYFSETYTDYEWLADNQLWLGKRSQASPQRYDEISIANKSPVPIVSMLITNIRHQSLIVFDIDSHSVIKMHTPPAALFGPKTVNFDVACRLADGSTVVSNPTHFPNLERYVGPLHFCLVLRDNKISIWSQELDGKYEDTESISRAIRGVGSSSIPAPKYVVIPKKSCILE
jgi:hypothetical protein